MCWNGTSLPKVFPTSFEIGHTFSGEPHDVAWSPRDTGLFYQNFMLGSTIQGPETVWRGSKMVRGDSTALAALTFHR